jgi:two-component system LytT family response regulator
MICLHKMQASLIILSIPEIYPPMSILNNTQPLLLRTSKGIQAIDMQNIVRIEAISNYSKLYFSNGETLVIAKVLRLLEAQLSSHRFIRVHRTHVVNRSFIHQYFAGEESRIKLLTGEYIEVSRRRKAGFLKCWMNVWA